MDEYRKEYNLKNREKISQQKKDYYQQNKEEHKIRMKKWRLNNSEKAKKVVKNYEEKNKEKVRKYHKTYDKNNLKRKSELFKEKYDSDINFKILSNLRTRLYSALKGKSKSKRTIQLLGCSVEEFKFYIELRFKIEMTWENHGKIWEIDHIIPCFSFDLSNQEEQVKCFHYSNLEPKFKTTEIAESFGYLYEIGNRNKSNKNININVIYKIPNRRFSNK